MGFESQIVEQVKTSTANEVHLMLETDTTQRVNPIGI